MRIIKPLFNNSNNLKISWFFNNFEFNPFLSKFVIFEQRIDDISDNGISRISNLSEAIEMIKNY